MDYFDKNRKFWNELPPGTVLINHFVTTRIYKNKDFRQTGLEIFLDKNTLFVFLEYFEQKIPKANIMKIFYDNNIYYRFFPYYDECTIVS